MSSSTSNLKVRRYQGFRRGGRLAAIVHGVVFGITIGASPAYAVEAVRAEVVDDVPVEAVPVEAVPVEEAPVEEVPVEEVPVEEVPVEDVAEDAGAVVNTNADVTGPSPAERSAVQTRAVHSFDDVDYGFAAERDIVVDGMTIRLLEAGPKDGPRVLLLHCWALSSQVWRDVMPVLAAAGYRVAAYDAPGHGKSDRSARRFDLESLGQTAVGVLDVLAWPTATLIGNSMGGGTALTVALSVPQRVERLVLLDAVGLGTSALVRATWTLAEPNLVRGSPDWVWELAYDLILHTTTPLSDRIRVELIETRSDPRSSFGADNWVRIIDDLNETDRAADLPSLTMPTLVVTGTHDILVPEAVSRAMAAGIPGAKLIVYDDVGHIPQIEVPARLSADLLAFLSSSSKVSPSSSSSKSSP